MKFDYKKFIAFGLMASFVFMFITGLVVYLSPTGNVESINSWLFFGMPIISWKTQFVFSFFFFLIFLVLLLISINWGVVKTYIQKEFPQKISGSKELWIALVVVFILLSISGLDLKVVQKLARVSAPGITQTQSIASSDDAITVSEEKVSLAEMKLSTLAGCYRGMSLQKAKEKIKQTGHKTPGADPILRKIADANDISINEIIKLVAKEEKLIPGRRPGIPISKRTLNEVIEEIGITKDDALTIFSKKNIQHTGDFDKSLKEISDENKILPVDLYTILNGDEPQLVVNEPPKQAQQAPPKSGPSEFELYAKDKTLDELSEIIKQQQPDAIVNKDVILERLSANKIKVNSDNETVGEIAKNNRTTIDDIFQIIAFGRRQPKPPVSGAQRVDGPPPHIAEGQSRAKALVQTTMEKLAADYKLNEAELLEALKNNGFEATKDETVEDLAKKYNARAGAIVKVLRDERLRQQGKNN